LLSWIGLENDINDSRQVHAGPPGPRLAASVLRGKTAFYHIDAGPVTESRPARRGRPCRFGARQGIFAGVR
jgi:hypothetical protein